MTTSFIDYERLVLQAYEQKQVDNTLPHGLKHLTPARLKEECVMRCSKGLSKRDEKVIRDFSGDLNESRTYPVIIQQCDTDKFRPLVNFLKGRSENTDPKNIELLAWLIDFPDRPWEIGKVYPTNLMESDTGRITGENPPTSLSATGGNKTTGNPVIPEDPITPNLPESPKEKESQDANAMGTSNQEKLRRKPAKRLAAAIMLSLALGTGGTWWWMDKNQPPNHNGGCMYWMEDHYEPIACNQKIHNAVIIALDTVKLKNFKKITMPDTITYLAIGKVWYAKIDSKIEYYTSEGDHPVVFGRRLKPITKYIIDKYIRSGTIAE
ncbi:hypothetical protein [Chitinophaga sp. XS-30]|uniref:hypothetical protein n=1 Tax=Chitinophaga sp. XS-30 TaxID=2604421 RepID=UPI0011DE0C5B|nr:hypothetical protein [Chitinophaga sp. XS-30]QEH41811.1 hypothetical protein FW415_13340 [Chitinophaga sp. XS-30]